MPLSIKHVLAVRTLTLKFVEPKATKRQQTKAHEVPKATSSETPLPATRRLKGKERKAAKDAADKTKKPNVNGSDSPAPATTTVKYTITTGELLRQAEAIIQNSEKTCVRMPASLRAVVERAIRARQRCSEWFRKSEVRNQYADKQHTHFTEILEQSLQILEPCMEAGELATSHLKHDTSSVEEIASISNRFAVLKVEESPDVDPAEVSEISAAINVAEKTKASKGEPEISVYELEDEDEFDEELAFLIFCKYSFNCFYKAHAV